MGLIVCVLVDVCFYGFFDDGVLGWIVFDFILGLDKVIIKICFDYVLGVLLVLVLLI